MCTAMRWRPERNPIYYAPTERKEKKHSNNNMPIWISKRLFLGISTESGRNCLRKKKILSRTYACIRQQESDYFGHPMAKNRYANILRELFSRPEASPDETLQAVFLQKKRKATTNAL